MATYVKNPPPKLVAQDRSQFHCWAASLDSWIATAKPKTPQASMTKLQPELIVSYKAFTGERDGLVIGKALVQVMFDFQMMVDLYKPQTTAATASAILQRLMMKGYLWAFYIGGPDLGEFIGHAMVIYGVVDSTGKAPTLKIMDPWTGTLTFMSMEDLNKTATVFVCWYETGPNWSNDMFRIMSAVAKAT